MKTSKKITSINQRATIAMFLTFTGGFIDSYAYSNFNHTLPLTQSGNMVLLTSDFILKDWSGVSIKLSTLLGFILGITVSRYLAQKVQLIFLEFYLLFLFLASIICSYFLIDRVSDPLALFPLSFGLALTVVSFDKVDGQPYNDAFTTGNIKKMVLYWSDFILTKDDNKKGLALLFTKVVFSFVIGALTSQYFQKLMLRHALLLALLPIMFLIIYVCDTIKHS
ncbi:integral membrane protein [Streptococcus gallolyticus]|uniref:Integral membrane protein n=1 Tax=Streptococcus gallolyticus TaxID=315405 RepID=A0AA94S942_9STRE|nr:YoaK family protein [Streptococcus gallolyticus]AQP41305.1 hypothetical protein BTR42_01530 [Streptococcus gallolyticus subsp. gallolyticus DSM 16831]SQG78587.1 integral membrane protein [Streptococcus gallolyticus]